MLGIGKLNFTAVNDQKLETPTYPSGHTIQLYQI